MTETQTTHKAVWVLGYLIKLNMDLQKMVDKMVEQSARDKAGYHLTYGELIKALKEAPSDAVIDKRIKGIGSYRGSYIEIALYTEKDGYYAEKSVTDYSYSTEEEHAQWEKENVIRGEFPRNANELGNLLESLLGMYFEGYKGGLYKIEEYKPLWLNKDKSTGERTAVIGIDENLNLITKEIE